MEQVRAWDPGVPLVREVFHATMAGHAYPAHTHDTWTVLLVDEGCVVYDLDRHARTSPSRRVSLLPPHVTHDGRSALPGTAFRKRVLYLDADWLPEPMTGATVDRPVVPRHDALTLVDDLHEALGRAEDVWQAESLLLALRDVVTEPGVLPGERPSDTPVARSLRELLDAHVVEGITLETAGRVLGLPPTRLARAFTRAYGIAPHRYLVGRRIDRARHLLLAGRLPAEAAVQAGFWDQAHLTRHFRRTVGTTPSRYAAGA